MTRRPTPPLARYARRRLIRSHWQFGALVFVAAFIVFLFGGTAL